MSTATHEQPRSAPRPAAAPAARDAAAGILTAAIVLLAAAASAAGLLDGDLYRDNAWSVANWRGNDLVTLLFLPVLAGAYRLAVRGSRRARLVWLGGLAYMVYNYAFYLFGAAFNDVFLLYAGLVAASIWALALGLSGTDAARYADGLRHATRVRVAAGYLAFAAIGLAVAWIGQSLQFAVTGTVPQIIEDSGIHTSLVFALDLSLAVPAMLVAALLLLRQRPWGLVLGAALGVKGTVYATVLLVMSAYQADRGAADAWGFAPVAVFLLLGSLLVVVALLAGLDRERQDDEYSGSAP